ncbi:ClpX C4-type zinc finger protein [Nisaea sp.]|uniref:ClpX C4-type zinc finger protein n=1 Tax=Nisaea sp. TaxID=2024842 RepID=UPI00329901BB
MADKAKAKPLFVAGRPDATCSFCGKGRDDTRYLVGGKSPTSHICNDCAFDALTCLVEAATREANAAASAAQGYAA